ncbi:MAG: LytR/AlgR family response regulator transcription factor [Vicinamibacterales bacterium]
MNRFRVLVADDEPLARTMVSALLKQDPEVMSVVECGSAHEVEQALRDARADIAFLDIEMPGMSGLDLATQLGTQGPAVVFVTAFAEYAARAFDVRAVDYVLKPFSDARLHEALERAKQTLDDQRLREQAPDGADGAVDGQRQEFLQRMAFKDGERSVILKMADVLWVEAQDYYVLVHSRLGRHLIRATLASLENRVDPQRFLRVHRGALVNVDEVRDIVEGHGIQLTLSDGARIPVSRSRRKRVESLLRPRLRQAPPPHAAAPPHGTAGSRP